MKPVAFAGLRPPTRPGPAVPFELACQCGQPIRGQRQAQAQVPRCPACGTERFVLPLSPLPAVLGTAAPSSVMLSGRGRLWIWIIPLAAAAVALVLAVGGIALLIRHADPNRTQASAPALSDDEQFERHAAAGRTALADGSFHKAATELTAALEVGDRLGGRWKTAERRQLTQQQRQAALLGDLLSDSLADVVRQSLGMPEAEWQQEFQRRYARRSFVLDAVVHRDTAGQYHQNHRHRVGKDEIRIDLKRLKLLESIPFSGPQQLLLGMRLAAVRHEGAAWLVVPEADSGVLITDREVIAALSLPAEYDEVLQRQQAWLRSVP
ncbi:MAG: hypothetical protein ACJ8F7_12165 [Gemmataceae bacterium]